MWKNFKRTTKDDQKQVSKKWCNVQRQIEFTKCRFQKIADYHKSTCNHTSLWDLSYVEKERFHLHPHFNNCFLFDRSLSKGEDYHRSSTYEGCECWRRQNL
jgi:hypothetical protein